jgi:hypothetical protein
MNFKHWIGVTVLIFVCIGIWSSGVLSGVPVAGKYLSQ